MENASKALLIAAAILIVILLIAVGMRVFNSASDTVGAGTDQMSTQEISMFNSQFTQYAGKSVSAANVKSLIETIQANNLKNTSGMKHITYSLVIPGNPATTTPSPTINAIDSGTYKVEVTDESTENATADGYYSLITITKT